MSDENRVKRRFYSAVNDEWFETYEPSDSFSQEADERGQIHQIDHCDGPAVTRASRTSDGIAVEITGTPPQNEAGVEPVCRRLALALQAATGVTSSASSERPSGVEIGVDWYITHGSEVVPVQVTRVGSQEMWSALARHGTVAYDRLNEQMAAEIARSIEAKRLRIDAKTILALDAGISGGFMFDQVVASWRSMYGAAVLGMHVREIWLVGYSPETTFCLYQPGLSRSDS